MFDVIGFIIALVIAIIASRAAMKRQKRRSLDGYLVKKLEDSAIDVTQSQPLEFWFYGNDKASISKIESDLKDQDYEVVLNKTEDDPLYVICAFKNLVPDISELQQLRKSFNKMGKPLGITYDGWGYAGTKLD